MPLEIWKTHRKTPVQVLINCRSWALFSCKFCEISKNTFSYGIPPVAACKNTVLLTHPGQDLIFSQLFLISAISMPLTKRHLQHMHVLIFYLFTNIPHHKLVAIINEHELSIFLKIKKRNTFQLIDMGSDITS